MTQTTPPLTALEPGARLHGLLLVLDVERRTLGGREATLLTLGNATGRLTSAPLWGTTPRSISDLAKGDVVEVSGRVGVFHKRRQLELATIRRAPADRVDRRALLPTVADCGHCWAALDRWRAAIRPGGLARVVSLFYDDPAFRRRYGECPASTAGHHAALGGLLRHTFEVAAIARAIADVTNADVDLVLAGALLHDLGKVEAYSWSGPFELTPAGALLGHVALGARMLDRRVCDSAEPPCTAPELDLLLHLVLSHHGKLEFGAAVQPMTVEAEILHYADDASAKSASLSDAQRDAANFTGSAVLSARIWSLDHRRVYRGGGEFGSADKGPKSGTAA